MPGGSGGVWRRQSAAGETRVHRPTGPWTPAVHELLEFLAEAELDGIPRLHGFDAEGDEVLDFLPGETLDPDAETASDEALSGAAAWLRRYHDAVRGFRPGTLEWRQGVQPLGPDQIICHNDPGLYNWVVADGEFAGMIDWDRAGPGFPIEDLAFLCWTGVPLNRDFPANEVAPRLALAAEAYGHVSPAELLDAVSERMALISHRWSEGIRRGDPGTLALRDSGVMERHHERVRDFEARRAGIRAALDR
nr:phosphotransferase [Leucobacter edaphi]